MDRLVLLFSLFLVIFIGFLVGKLKVLPKETSSILNKFLFNISIPLLLFVSIINIDKSQISQYPTFIAVNSILVVAMYLSIYLILKILKLKHEILSVILLASTSGNLIFFGFPIILNLFGQEHFSFATVYVATVAVVNNIVGFFLIEISKSSGQENRSFKYITDFLKNPIVVSSYLALIFLFLGIKLPQIFENSFSILSEGTSGLALFSVGIYFAYNLKLSNIKLTLLPVFIKLLLRPFIAFLLVYYVFDFSSVAAVTSVIMGSMPTSVSSVIVADNFKLDRNLASNTFIVCSILFLFTISFWIWFLDSQMT